jgi:hydrogenase-1 operon protein HyaF
MNQPAGAHCQTGLVTGMALSIMAEIARMLEALADKGESGSIDLRSLPLTNADRDQLEELMGRGEVKAELEVSGDSTVWETSYPGAWWIRHRGAGGKISSEEISICAVPAILSAHPADIEAAANRIKNAIAELNPSQAEASNG